MTTSGQLYRRLPIPLISNKRYTLKNLISQVFTSLKCTKAAFYPRPYYRGGCHNNAKGEKLK